MAKNQEKLEAQKLTPKEKRAEKKDLREKELQAETDLFLRKYLEIKDGDPEADKNRQYWRDQYFNKYSMTQFRGEKLGTFGQDEDKVWELNIEDYQSRMSGNGSIFGKQGGSVHSTLGEGNNDGDGEFLKPVKLEDIISDRDALKKEIEGSLKENDKAGIQKVVQDFYDKGIQPDDLLGKQGKENQGRAIKALFPYNPELGLKVARIIWMTPEERASNPELFKSTEEFIKKTHVIIKKELEAFSQTRTSTDHFSEEVAGDYLKKKLGNSMDYFREKPVAGMMGIAAIGGLLYYMSSGDDKSWRKTAWDWIKSSVPWVGGAIGLNIATSMYRDDGRSALDLIFDNADSYSYDNVTQQFKDDIESMTDNNRNAFEGMLHLANTDAEAVYDVFDEARRSHKETINPKVLLSLGGITKKQADSISGDNLYIGLEGMMHKLGDRAGATGSRNDVIAKGQAEYKKYTKNNPGLKFASIIYLMEKDIAATNARKQGRDLDGTVIDSAKAGAAGVAGALGIGGATEIAAADGSSGGTDGGSAEAKKSENPFLDGVIDNPEKKNVTEAKEHMKTFVDDQYARLDKYVDSYWVKFKSALHLGDKFRSVVKQRKLISIDRLNEIFKDKTDTNPGDLKKDLTKFTEDLKLEIDEYCAVLENRDSNSETVINDLMSDMVKDMMGDEVWEDSADYVFKTINSRFELEGGSHLFDDPEILVSFMRVYFKKIEWGRDRGGIVSKKDAQDYADFFLDKATKLVVDSPNISLDNFDGKTKEISTEDWTRAVNNLGSIDDFQVWAKTKPIATKLEENDAARAIQRRESENNTTYREALLKRETARINAAFGPADKLDTGIFKDLFEARIGRRKSDYIDELTAVTGTGAAAEMAMDVIVAKAEAEGEMFKKYSAIEGHNTPTVLMEVQREMIEHVVKEKNWQESAKQVFNYTNTSYEFEGATYMFDEPEVSIQLMDLYYKNIDNGADIVTDADVEGYTDYFISELSNTLADDKNISPDNIDGYVKQISTKEWGQIQNQVGQIPTYKEWAVTKIYRPKLKENDQKRAVTDRVAEEGTELDKYLRERIKQIDVKFAEVEQLDKNILPDNFDAFISMRRQAYDKKLADTAKGKADIPATRAALDAIVSDAQQEVLDYLQFKGRASSSPVVLLEAEKIMLKHELNRSDWQASAEKVLQFANATYEYENPTYIINDPQLFADFIKVYQSKIEGSAVGVASKDAEDYTRFFLFNMDKILPKDPNYAIGSPRKQISAGEWEACKNKMDSIPKYNEWMSLTPAQKAKPELVQNDLDRAVSERIKEEKKESDKAFMKWFDKEADVSQWLRLDGAWPEEFRTQVSNRLIRLSQNPAYKNLTNEEYQKTLQEYARYVIVEKRFYELMIDQNIDPDQMKTHVVKSIEASFDNNFMKPGKTARDYNDALQTELGRDTKIAGIIDLLTIQVGPLYLPIVDVINFYPGGF